MKNIANETIHKLANNLRKAHKEDVKNHYNKWEIKLSDEQANEIAKSYKLITRR